MSDVEPVLPHDKRTLKQNYSVTDIADEYCRERLEWYGFYPEQFGMDDRDNRDSPKYSSKPDLCVRDYDDEVVGFCEIKAKSVGHEDWFGRINQHMWYNYLNGEWDEPVFVFMSVVDTDRQTICRECVIPVLEETEIDYSFNAQGGKRVLQFHAEWYRPWREMIVAFEEQ